MSRPFLSRHFLSEGATCLAALPFAAAGAAGEDGLPVTHNLMAAGSWSEDGQECRLSLLDLAVKYSGTDVADTPAVRTLAYFVHTDALTGVATADLGGGSVLVAAASCDGCVARLRLQVPTAPGSSPEEIQLEADDFDDIALVPWLDAHSSGVTALDIHSDSRRLLSASSDGSLVINPLDAELSALPLYTCEGGATFTAAHWTTPHVFLTCTLQGALQVWDARQGGKAASQLSKPAAVRQPLMSLAVHPANPHACGTGSAGGDIALWDLRGAGAAPVQQVAVAGSVDGLSYYDGAGVPLAFCTSRGAVGVVREGGSQAVLLHEEPGAAVVGMCLSTAGAVSQLCCCNDQEGLLFMANAL